MAKPHTPISAAAHFLYFYTWVAGENHTALQNEATRNARSLPSDAWKHFFEPSQLLFLPMLSLSKGVFKVCTLSLSGYVFFTFRI